MHRKYDIPDPDKKFNQRLGRCYELAGRFVMHNRDCKIKTMNREISEKLKHPSADVQMLREKVPGSEYGHLRGIWQPGNYIAGDKNRSCEHLQIC